MATESIGSYLQTDSYSLLKAAVEEKQLYQKANALEDETGSESGSAALRAEITALLDQIPKGSDGKLSFQDVEDYRESLGEAWDTAVMADLEALGVDVSKEFMMTYDPDTGAVTVSGDTDDKAIIDQYFVDNPDKVEAFRDIIQLGKLTTTASSQLSQDTLMTSLQQQSLAWWYEDNTDPTSWFEGGGLLSIGQGSTTSYTGINLMV